VRALLLNHARAADKTSDFASNLPRSVACLRAPCTCDQIVLARRQLESRHDR
jgi:hypothetical protein